MLITRTPVTIPTQSLGWSLLGALLVSHLSSLGTSKTNNSGSLDRSGYYHHICRTAHFAHYHLYMRLCQRESVLRSVLLSADVQVVFANCIQWALYGNHPTPVALMGMIIVLAGGLYGVVRTSLVPENPR
jgi:hypothetical protein